MEPAFFRGDLLFLTNFKSDPIRVGEILVFKVGAFRPCCLMPPTACTPFSFLFPMPIATSLR